MNSDAKKGRVILTYGRSLMTLTAAHSLGKRNIEVIGCDDVDATVVGFSRYVEEYFIHAPYRKDKEKYLADLEKNIRKFKPADDRPYILMPMFKDTQILAEHKERFEGLITIAAPDTAAIEKVMTKDAFAATCEELDLQAPKTIKTENIEALEARQDEITFPALIKPYDDVGGRGIHKVGTFDELKERYQESIEHYGEPPLVQEIIEGDDYCLAAICDQGEIVSCMAYKNLYQFPRRSGAGIMRETIDESPFVDTAQKLLKALGWHGVAQLDFRWSGIEGEPPYLIEVNPRFWAGLFHSVESGVDFPWLLYQLFADGRIADTSHVEIGFKSKMPGLWRLSALQDIIESEMDFKNFKDVWKKIWSKESDENLKQRLGALASCLKDSVDSEDIRAKIKEMNESGKIAKSEFGMEDDPFVGLGLLFVASSLIRHGELPPELKH